MLRQLVFHKLVYHTAIGLQGEWEFTSEIEAGEDSLCPHYVTTVALKER
jgi:hypothetical protein